MSGYGICSGCERTIGLTPNKGLVRFHRQFNYARASRYGGPACEGVGKPPRDEKKPIHTTTEGDR